MRKTYRKDELYDWNPRNVARCWELKREGMNSSEIAAVLKTTKNSVINQLRKPCPTTMQPSSGASRQESA